MHASLAAPLSLVFSPLVFWPYFAGAALTLIGVFAVRRELTEASGLDKILALGRRVRRRIPRGFQRRAFWASQVHSTGCALLDSVAPVLGLLCGLRLAGRGFEHRNQSTSTPVRHLIGSHDLFLRALDSPAQGTGEPARPDCMGRLGPGFLFRRRCLGSGRISHGRVENSRYPQADHARASSDRSGCGVLRGRTLAAFPIRARRSSWQAHAHVVSRSSSYRVRSRARS